VKTEIRKALTIAGSDSGGGAGIEADIKTFQAFGVYGMAAITSVTAQNTVGVQGIYDLPAEFVGMQIDSVVGDIGVDAAKTGMLSNSDIIRVVSERISRYGMKVVVDPVMIAKSGDPLLREEARDALVGELLPLAFLVTPNLSEAEAIAGLRISSVDDMRRAAEAIRSLGPRNVLIKGGHLEGDAVDVLYDGRDFSEYRAERIATENTHGTGCTYSAAITAGIAKGKPLEVAVSEAKSFVTEAIRHSLNIGRGRGPLNHFVRAV